MNRSERTSTPARLDDPFRAAMADWQNVVLALDSVDPVTTEVVRVRAARHHDCRT